MAGVDRISVLPEEIKVSILFRLPSLSPMPSARRLSPAPGVNSGPSSWSSCAGLPYFRLLQDLKLFNVDISLPSNFRGFEQLTDLILYKVYISQQDIQSLINGSKKLRIIQCFLLRDDGAPSLSVTFSCPSLEYICFRFYMNNAEVRIISAPCLEVAHVTAPLWSAPPELVWVGAAALKFLADIAQVSYLSLSPYVLMGLSQVGVPHTLRFHQLRCLELSMILSIDQTMHKVFCSLLRSMLLLEILELTCYESMESGKRLYESDPILPDEYKKVDGYLCLNQTLRRVAISMENLRGLKDLMWSIHFMFLNANVLEVIRITYCNEDPMVKSRILEDLRKVEKASSDAQIVFVNVNDVS
ncbi:hypothetical protein LUZ61_004629 [Rhynchospora tenuis]|uniref:F-box/LRR-repeat protein 15/At3g58940/PEG3-like LRR domain-containing protein n=1 Tax=Rhynchospora tenuis TaxID=198213 RepID=A0AAD5ZN33_9POAL|nr:hypothetical protein LUZ61_004629 [Rhynchospora tenuis]